jgi:hypothetical protein
MTHELVSVSGFEPFEPEEWDYKFGDWINKGIDNHD